MRFIVLLSIILTFCCTSAEARHRHHQHYSHHHAYRAHVVKTTNTEFCGFFNPCQTQSRKTETAGFLQPSIQSWQHENRGRVRQASVGSRPSDCYGIAWCGCYLRHIYGINDKRLNLARAWASVGSNAGGPHVGAVVVWAHHVGKITGQDTHGNWIVLSGNSGRAGVTEVPRSIKRAIAFRDI
jgi:hypothetical protein